MKRIKKYLPVIKPYIYLVFIFFIVTFGIVIINYIINIIIGFSTGEFDFNKEILFDIPHLHELLMFSTAIIIYFIWYRKLKRSDKALVKAKQIKVKDACFILILGLGDLFITYGIMNLLNVIITRYYPQVISNYNSMMSYIDDGNLMLLVLRSVILGPIYEELVFRGVILKKANYIKPFYKANIFQALLFAISHLSWIQFLYVFPGALLYGYVTFKYRTLFPSVFLHIFNNASALLISKYLDKVEKPSYISTGFFVALTLVGILLFTLDFYFMRRNTAINENHT